MATTTQPLFTVPLGLEPLLTSKPWQHLDRFSFSQWPVSVQAWLVQEVVFHAVGLLFEYADQHKSLERFKVRKLRQSGYAKLLPNVLRNQIFVLLPMMWLSEYLGYCFTGPKQLSLFRFIASLPAMAIGHDIIQYIGHRYILHFPSVWMMKTFKHSIHHSTKANSAISACYMSSIDFFIEIVCPYLLPLALVGGGGSGTFFHFLVAGTGAIGGLYEHSGFDFSLYFRKRDPQPEDKPEATEAAEHEEEQGPVLKAVTSFLADFLDNRAHLEHHRRGYVSFSDGFGSPGICDTLLATRWDLSEKRKADVEKEWARQRH
ncbi:hypothetical protein VHUM_04058 [Vanrija humicola]|uniref:Fatty acid hydroxylase domain-containing protein n=1 Tax=Vanrija humicola TaxID=5417 RepID=A0A7D8UWC5_VANHU|nr:hypothetical protein VHUM_04058 [Vanrija humicola]